MKHRAFCLLLALICCLGLCLGGGSPARAEAAFHYNDSITWGMSPDDVLALETTPEDGIREMGSLKSLTVKRQTDRTQKISYVTYLFLDDSLSMIEESVLHDTSDYSIIDQDGVEVAVPTAWHYDTALAAMVDRYGEPGPGDPERCCDLLWRLGLLYDRDWGIIGYQNRAEQGQSLMDWELKDTYIWWEELKGDCHISYASKALEE